MLLVLVAAFVVAEKFGFSTTTTQQKAEEPACRADWRKCSDNAQLVNNYDGMSLAKVRCQTRAEEMAKYGSPKWPWPTFGTFFKGDDAIKTGRILIEEPDAQFQNGFGAWAHNMVLCKFDLTSKQVVDLSITQR